MYSKTGFRFLSSLFKGYTIRRSLHPYKTSLTIGRVGAITKFDGFFFFFFGYRVIKWVNKVITDLLKKKSLWGDNKHRFFISRDIFSYPRLTCWFRHQSSLKPYFFASSSLCHLPLRLLRAMISYPQRQNLVLTMRPLSFVLRSSSLHLFLPCNFTRFSSFLTLPFVHVFVMTCPCLPPMVPYVLCLFKVGLSFVLCYLTSVRSLLHLVCFPHNESFVLLCFRIHFNFLAGTVIPNTHVLRSLVRPSV